MHPISSRASNGAQGTAQPTYKAANMHLLKFGGIAVVIFMGY
jgi:hypothetical protein